MTSNDALGSGPSVAVVAGGPVVGVGPAAAGGPVVGVIAGCGGAGASTFAAVVAACAAAMAGAEVQSGVRPGAFLLDCDPIGGGIDVLLGAERTAGPRWRQVRLRGGELAPELLFETLPRWRGVSFLAADTAAPIAAGDVEQITRSARRAALVVLDVPRWPSELRERCLSLCDSVVLVTAAEVRAVTASALVAAALDPARSWVVARGTSRALPLDRIGEALGLSVLGAVPYDPACSHPDGLSVAGLRRETRRLATLAGLAHPDGRAA
ncbi:hypothetical protein M6D93_17935 [Jatrophihabitans telluris]|uniref:Uncharacterized protein n=1 Tax=Jatrophihabitans telluris TaxID=2038343 RepID=A0ABY4QX97_9ACTN|nr:hypothetical protein [Jatrophihabitans telluris]UQX88150.1 hypothetical protein M6D93_17935 [Jatrophihabitans telluris]